MTDRIQYILNNPLEVKASDLLLIQEEREKYPFCYPLHLLQAKINFNVDKVQDSRNIQQVSIYASNRKILYDYLHYHNQYITQNNKEEIVKKEFLPDVVHKDEDKGIIAKIDEKDSIIVSESLIEENSEIDKKLSVENTKQKDAVIVELNDENKEKPVQAVGADETLSEDEPINREFIKGNHSFTEWLKINAHSISDTKEPDVSEQVQPQDEVEEKFQIIEEFLEKNPKITPAKAYKPNIEINTNPKGNLSHLMTETLANIYVEQNKYDKAIKAYRILRLKYPEKSGYFADRIKEIIDLKNK